MARSALEPRGVAAQSGADLRLYVTFVAIVGLFWRGGDSRSLFGDGEWRGKWREGSCGRDSMSFLTLQKVSFLLDLVSPLVLDRMIVQGVLWIAECCGLPTPPPPPPPRSREF